jgi:hypothetical protein
MGAAAVPARCAAISVESSDGPAVTVVAVIV